MLYNWTEWVILSEIKTPGLYEQRAVVSVWIHVVDFSYWTKGTCPCLEVNAVWSSAKLWKQRVKQRAESYNTGWLRHGSQISNPWSASRACLSVCLSAAHWSCLQTTCQHTQAADGSSETHSEQANSFRDVLDPERGRMSSWFLFTFSLKVQNGF